MQAHSSSGAGRSDRPERGAPGPVRPTRQARTERRLLHFPYCDEVSKYEKLTKVGQGTFGEVWKARDRTTREYVALKKVLMDNEKEGFPLTALREVKILQKLHDKNVVRLIEICRGRPAPHVQGTHIYLVFEFCEHDLAGLLSNQSVKFSLGEIKEVILQLLNGLYFLHHHNILHRDIKAANILITKGGQLKLADFGLARAFSTNKEHQRYTSRVVTLWYRPPELLLGDRDYGPAIDVWGIGCIMAEMWTRAPILQGRTEQHQLQIIIQLCGAINEVSYPDCSKLPLYNKLYFAVEKSAGKQNVKDRMKAFTKDPLAVDLIERMLTLNPKARISTNDALNHEFFWNDPMPAPLAGMLSQHLTSNFEFLAPRRGGGPSAAAQHGGRPAGAGSSASSFTRDYTSASFDPIY